MNGNARPARRGRKAGRLAVIGLALGLAGGGAWAHELRAEVLRESDFFPFGYPPNYAEQQQLNAQACNRAKFAAENLMQRLRHNWALSLTECACTTHFLFSSGVRRHWVECRLDAFGKDREELGR